jgi:hypothetical protein
MPTIKISKRYVCPWCINEFETKLFTKEKTAEENKLIMERACNTISAFVQDCLIQEQGSWISKDDLYQLYAAYVNHQGLGLESKSKFGRSIQMKANFLTESRKDTNLKKSEHGWLNVGLNLTNDQKNDLNTRNTTLFYTIITRKDSIYYIKYNIKNSRITSIQDFAETDSDTPLKWDDKLLVWKKCQVDGCNETPCNLDSNVNQTRSIMKRQAERAVNGLRVAYDKDLIAILTYLDRYSVIIPYAGKLLTFLPDGIIMRTHFQRILDFIKASCCLYQYQRELDIETGCLIAEKQDYEIAMQVLNKLTSNSKMISLTKNQQKILEIFQSLDKGVSYSAGELEPKITFISERQLYRELDKLADFGFLEKGKEDRVDSRKAVMVYRYIESSKIQLPVWDELQKNVK